MFMQYRNHLKERREFVLLIVDVGGKGDEVNLNNFLVLDLLGLRGRVSIKVVKPS